MRFEIFLLCVSGRSCVCVCVIILCLLLLVHIDARRLEHFQHGSRDTTLLGICVCLWSLCNWSGRSCVYVCMVMIYLLLLVHIDARISIMEVEIPRCWLSVHVCGHCVIWDSYLRHPHAQR